MNKQDFTIEGSIALKKAFIEELGITEFITTKQEALSYSYIGTSSKDNRFQGWNIKGDTHFILPQDWEKAIDYTKEYFRKDPEFKVGDWVVWKTDPDNKPYKLLKITEDEFVVEFLPAPSCGVYVGKIEDNCRLATSKEIKFVQDKELLDKLIKENGFKVGDRIKTTGTPDIEGVIKKFHLDLYPTKEQGDMFLYAELEDGKRFVLQNWYKEPLFKLCPKSKTLVLGDKRIKFTVYRDKIEADGTVFGILDWEDLLQNMKKQPSLKQYLVTYPTVKVGCTTLTIEDIELLISTYNELND